MHSATGRTFTSAQELASAIPRSRRCGSGFMASCPVHQDRTPSLSIRDGDKAIILKCFSRDCSYAEIMAAIGGQVVPALEQKPAERKAPSTDKVIQIWSESAPVSKDDPVWLYLRETRKLALSVVPLAIRYHPALEYWEQDEHDRWTMAGLFPGMVAAFTDLTGAVSAVHRTFLTRNGQKGFDQESGRACRRVKGTIAGSAIKLFEAGEVVGVAEGIETALAAHQLFGVRTWAAYSTSNMQNLVIPESVREVLIFGDNDVHHAGQKAAAKLAARLTSEGRRCKLVVPNKPGTDWADYLEETYNAF